MTSSTANQKRGARDVVVHLSILKHAEVNTTVLITAKNFDKMPNVEAMLFSKNANLEKILVPLASALVEKLCKLEPPTHPPL